MPTTNTKVKIRTEESLILMSTKDDNWELTKASLHVPHAKLAERDAHTDIYVCYHYGVLWWVESTLGLALQKFMNIIPNKIRDTI